MAKILGKTAGPTTMTKRTLALLWGIVALAVLGCASPSSDPDGTCSNAGPKGSQTEEACACADGRASTQTIDSCTGSVLSACDCSIEQECVGNFGCKGSQTCSAPGEACGACSCPLTDVWPPIYASSGHVVDMSGDGKGHVALLLSGAPWLALINPHGTLIQVQVQSALAWAGRVWATPDGAIVALSRPGQLGVQFQRFDLDGSLVGSGSWSADPKASLVEAAARPDGQLALLASSDSGHTLLTLSSNDELKPTGTLQVTSGQAIGCCNSKPTSFAVSPSGEYLLTGYMQPATGVWWAKVDESGRALANHFFENVNVGKSSPKVVTSTGGEFTAFTSLANFEGGPGMTSVLRLGRKLDELWQRVSGDTHSVLGDFVALPDGALSAGRANAALALVRYDRDGNSWASAISGSDPARLVVASDYNVVVLKQPADQRSNVGFTLEQLSLSPLPAALEPAGGLCELDADCASTHCCFQGAAKAGKCGEEAGCTLNDHCSSDAECASGTCLLGVAVCSQACSQSKDCPANSYCAEACSVMPCVSVCLPQCLGQSANYCEALGSWKCQQTDNTEGVQVSLCQP